MIPAGSVRDLSSRARSQGSAASTDEFGNPEENGGVFACSEDGSALGGDEEILEPRVSVMLFIPGTRQLPLPHHLFIAVYFAAYKLVLSG